MRRSLDISIDCHARCVRQTARDALEARPYELNARRDGAIFRTAKESSLRPAGRPIQSVRSIRTARRRSPYFVPRKLHSFDEGWIAERYERSGQPGYMPRILFSGW